MAIREQKRRSNRVCWSTTYAALVRNIRIARRGDILVVGARYMRESSLLILFRGTLTPILVPFEWFGEDRRLDFDRMDLLDYGHTIKIGQSEIAADAVLYDFDVGYRRKAKARLLADSKGIGGSIRRLRKQRGLRQEDFDGVSRREMVRIERGEIEQPHKETLLRISQKLGVSLNELSTY